MGVSKEDIAEVMGLPRRAMWRVLGNYKRSAQRRGHAFNLSEDHFFDLILHECSYCYAAPSNSITVKDGGISYTLRYQGIDRVDNSRGYETNNVVSCCLSCNSVKGRRGRESFIEHAKAIARVAE